MKRILIPIAALLLATGCEKLEPYRYHRLRQRDLMLIYSLAYEKGKHCVLVEGRGNMEGQRVRWEADSAAMVKLLSINY